jgi:CoA:oxalate CoA-transferase
VRAVLDAAGGPAAPIWNIAQALASPQSQARGLLGAVQDPRLPGLRLPTQPVHFSGAAPNRAERAPALGEHTEALLSQWLGRGAEAIAALRASGALGNAGAASSSQPH